MKTDKEKLKIAEEALKSIARHSCECGIPCDCLPWKYLVDIAKSSLANIKGK